MSAPRVTTAFWVGMALRMGQGDGRFGIVIRKGDPDAGGILVMLRGPQGLSVLSRLRDEAGETTWIRGTGPAPVDQEAADAYVARQVRIDPDLWVLEFDAPDMLPPFEARIL